MGTEHEDLAALAKKYRDGTCTPEELKRIRMWYDEFEYNGYTLPKDSEVNRASMEAAMSVIQKVAADQQQSKLQAGLEKHIDTATAITPVIWFSKAVIRYTVAASILIFTGLGMYLLNKAPQKTVQIAHAQKKDFAPGGNKAILTLGNGQQIVLNNAQTGTLAHQGNVVINKAGNGLVTYQQNKGDAGNTSPGEINSISTPRGGEYQVTLPDGTKAWLNSSSSIRFPVVFNGGQRRVETTGEVYFEVAKNKLKPFVVTTGQQTITVLGTHFNVMAYPDEQNMVTTLVEGSVKISKGKQNRILAPGEQAIVDDGIKVTDADIDDAIAWKNGITSFTDADIKTIMRKVARWYDVDIEYQGRVTDRTFTGGISRKSNLSVLLKVLTLNNIQFTVAGKKIIVK